MDRKPENHMRKFGLLGKQIGYSFSKQYFTNKFEIEGICDATYENFDIDDISKLPNILNHSGLRGLNVTIPYKEAVIPFLDKLNKQAKKIGAVNTIKITKNGKHIGYNTDYYGFIKSLEPLLKKQHKSALILGTGGASKAIAYALENLNIEYRYVSRSIINRGFTYDHLTEDIVQNYKIIINCTPLGTFPNVENFPQIPYHAISSDHILFDLIYNPEETKFLKYGKAKNATVINGYRMLVLQAEKSWKIWNS